MEDPTPAPRKAGLVPIRSLGAGHRRRIAAHLLALDEQDRYLRLPPATLDSRMTELLEEQVAQADYRLKQQAKRFLGFLQQLQDIRRAASAARSKSGR